MRLTCRCKRADIHHASRTGDRLRYPPIRTYYSIVATEKHIPDAKAKRLTEQLSSAFDTLGGLLLSVDIRKALQNGIEATVALDHHRRHENDHPRLKDVMLAANEAQRVFLELMPLEGSGLAQLVHNVCRLAALVSFPHSPPHLMHSTHEARPKPRTEILRPS